MAIESRVTRLELERRERDWLRVMRQYPQVSADEIEELIAAHVIFRTWTEQQLEAFAKTGARPAGVEFPERV